MVRACTAKHCSEKLSEYHSENVLILSSPVFINVMVFRSELAQSLHLVKNNDDDVEHCVDNECLALKMKRNTYHINIDKELVRESVGDTIALILQIYQPNATRSVAGNDVDREHYNRDSVVPTNRSPSSIKGTIS